MPAKKGFTNNPNGRKKGVPNKVTSDIKEAYRLLVENNLSNMQGWLNEIAAKEPARALNILIELSEYVVPKLARTEVDAKFREVSDYPTSFKVIIEDSRSEIPNAELNKID